MKAYRARAAEVCVRLEPKTMATLDSIADEIGYSRNELMQSMVKFGLTNRDWRNEGLTAHKRLPRYQENPSMATRTPTPAQLAARERFAEMARSGVLNRKRQIAAKKSGGVKRNPMHRAPRGFVLADEYTVEVFNPRGLKPYDAVFMKTVGGAGEPKYDLTILKSSSGFMAATGSKVYPDEFPTAAAAAAWLMDWYKANKRPAARRTNPAKKTVSQKISQLVHEGYPQRQAVAVALNEERAGKVKRNPAAKPKKQRMLNISWLTAGGQREVMSVPIEFTFTEYVGNVAEKFFARIENGFLVVSEYGTGGKIGTVPYSMRGAVLNDREAAKLFTRKAIEATGPERFHAAIRKFSTIN